MVDERYKKRLLDLINRYFPEAHVYLYGSRARGDHELASDIDVAIDMGHKADERKMARIRLSLEDHSF
jgi:predicted nucleotidyltransferase